MGGEEVDVIIVGGGVSGITAAYHVKQKGLSFVILEAASRYGGTWERIRFPGIRSDSDMFTYSFSWYHWKSQDKLANACDINAYLDEAVAFAGIGDAFRFDTTVLAAAYSSKEARWRVETRDGRVYSSQFLFMTAGYYEYDTVFSPEFDGKERFNGRVVHPHQWRPERSEWEGKNVVVIGSGATAATIVPAMARSGAKHVTMLQRSPGYWLAEPRRARVYNTVSAVVGDEIAFHLVRAFFTCMAWLIITLCTWVPDLMRGVFRKRMAPLLPKDFDAGVHFNPRYKPWDERVCLIADGDFFACLRDGSVSVVTDTVDHFEEDGIALSSGERLGDVDLVCTATGFNLHSTLPFPTRLSISVDGTAYDPRSHFFYNSCMVSDVPNLVFTMGYFRYSWTLKADMVAAYAAELFTHVRNGGKQSFCPRPPACVTEVTDLPSDALTCGYLKRHVHCITRSGSGLWNISQSVFTDYWRLRCAPYGKELQFD